MFKNNASVFEEELISDVTKMMEDNPTLFKDEKVVLMADAHRGAGVPVGFTMTLTKGLVPIEFVGSDIGCGVTGYILKDLTLTPFQLKRLSLHMRDLVQVNRRLEYLGDTSTVTDFGTLGNSNHFVEIGTNGKDLLIAAHSGSRAKGGEFYKKTKALAIQNGKKRRDALVKEVLETIPPKQRQEALKDIKIKMDSTPILHLEDYPDYLSDLGEVIDYASLNRLHILDSILTFLGQDLKVDLSHLTVVDSKHNYIDDWEDIPVLRKGAIKANEGKRVIIPINMRDGIIVGVAKDASDSNNSLPHGAGRVLGRKAAFEALDYEEFKEDMKNILTPTMSHGILDESPRAYKSIDVILKDIEPYLSEYEVFKPLINFKGE